MKVGKKRLLSEMSDDGVLEETSNFQNMQSEIKQIFNKFENSSQSHSSTED